LELKRIEAAKEIIENLSKTNNVIYLPSGGMTGPGGVGGSGTNFLYKL
jgi:hypothetical protein